MCPFFSPSTIYILLLIFSPGPLYSREYSRISRIFLSLGRSTEAKNRSKYTVVSPKPPGIAQHSKIPPASTQSLLLRGKRAVLGSSSQEVVDATVVTPRIFANILKIEVNHCQGAEEKLYEAACQPFRSRGGRALGGCGDGGICARGK